MKRFFSVLAAAGLLANAVTLSAAEPAKAPELTPVSVAGGAAKLTPRNTQIRFVGVHEGDKPDPRTGGFDRFTGRAEVDASGNLQSVELEIDTASLRTEIDRLTAHLKSPDFFNVRQHPTATFRATQLTPGKTAGKFMLRGELTLLGVTRPMQVPATVESGPQGLTLASDFTFDRREFGMEYGQGKVKNEVTVRVRIGQPTTESLGATAPPAE